jgi:thiamine-phosphate pyrophosphorylase
MYPAKKILRVIDANVNRCKEGLRVVEDIFRFVIEDDDLRTQVRKIRHSIDRVTKSTDLRLRLIASRDSKSDLGKEVDVLEVKRKNIPHIFHVNLQRAKESLRVLEEFFKLIDVNKVKIVKRKRYEIYQIEKDALKQWSSLRHFR